MTNSAMENTEEAAQIAPALPKIGGAIVHPIGPDLPPPIDDRLPFIVAATLCGGVLGTMMIPGVRSAVIAALSCGPC